MEHLAALVLVEEHGELGDVRRVQGRNDRDELEPLAGRDEFADVGLQILG
jgi:NTP pyrophosphatase (non-canonical NTP hydrolase)